MKSSADDAIYIISDSGSDSDFKATPFYGIYSYSDIRAGDIVFETQTILNDIGHTAIITNTSATGNKYGSYIQTIEAVTGWDL